ncbi:MAG: TIGR01777 family oxidoreductase [Bacteroidota bacterium]
MKTLIIAGGSGFLGQVLTDYFKNKVEQIYILSRSNHVSHKTSTEAQVKEKGNIQFLPWDAKTLGPWSAYLEDADVLINMTGKSVDCRYHQKNRDLILSSRVDATRILGQAIMQCERPPKVWLNSSTATIYRHSTDLEMDETDGEIGEGFSVSVAQAWEKEFFSYALPKTRQVALRTSIVLGKEGGAFVPIKRLTQLGFGGKQGPGNQKVSWIHEEDFARSIEFILQKKEIQGVINIVSPTPTTNAQLMQTLRKKIGIPFGIPMGKSMLELGAKIIQTETELILKSRNVIPKKLIEYGFTFNYPKLDETLTHLLKS